MSISYRSLGILAVVVLVGVLACVLWGSAAGPRPALVESLSPFPAERLPIAKAETNSVFDERVEDQVALLPQNEYFPGSGVSVDADAISILSSRLRGASDVEIPLNTDLGNVVLFQPAAPKWLADSNGDGELNEADIDDFGDLWTWADPKADFNLDGIVDPDDYAAFVEAYDSRGVYEAMEKIFLGRTVELRFDAKFSGGSFLVQESINIQPLVTINGQ